MKRPGYFNICVIVLGTSLGAHGLTQSNADALSTPVVDDAGETSAEASRANAPLSFPAPQSGGSIAVVKTADSVISDSTATATTVVPDVAKPPPINSATSVPTCSQASLNKRPLVECIELDAGEPLRIEEPGDTLLEISPLLRPEVQEMVTQALLHPALEGARVGLYVRSLNSGAVLLRKNPDLLLNPASNAKLATAATALVQLGPEYRYETTYATHGELIDGKLKGRLYVSGRGDPTITTERLLHVAHQLKMMGLNEISGGIVVDDSFFDGDREALGWEEETSDHAYAAPVGALSLNYNAVAVDVYPGKQVGAPARIVVDPPSHYIDVDSKVATVRWGGRVYMSTRQWGRKTRVRLRGRVNLGKDPFRLYRRVVDPGLHFGGALVGILSELGIKVRGHVRRGLMPESARVLMTDYSEPLALIVNRLNKYSNNFIAESLVKTLGAEFFGSPGSFANGHRVVREFLQQEVGWRADSYVYENGSGLNNVNRFSAQQIAHLLAWMRWQDTAGPEFVSSLSVAGRQGTLTSRLVGTRAEARLRAKTGTLTGVSALSGYISTADGEPLVFSILMNGYKGSVRPIWEVQDMIAEALAVQGQSSEGPPQLGRLQAHADASP